MREYVPNLMKVINGLMRKLSEKIPWEWTSEDTNCVLRTKELTKTLKPLRILEDNESLIVKSDASHMYRMDSKISIE